VLQCAVGVAVGVAVHVAGYVAVCLQREIERTAASPLVCNGGGASRNEQVYVAVDVAGHVAVRVAISVAVCVAVCVTECVCNERLSVYE